MSGAGAGAVTDGTAGDAAPVRRIRDDQIPYLPRGVRLHFDRVRDAHVLLAPERVIQLDPIGQAILGELDGARSFGQIVARLSAQYQAPAEQISGDVHEFLLGLFNRRMVFVLEGDPV